MKNLFLFDKFSNSETSNVLLLSFYILILFDIFSKCTILHYLYPNYQTNTYGCKLIFYL